MTFDYPNGNWIKFEVKRVTVTPARPHGFKYSLTLHDASGNRLVGFDNAHGVQPLGGGNNKKLSEYDHWHRTQFDTGRPYIFRGIKQLFDDFFKAVDVTLASYNQ